MNYEIVNRATLPERPRAQIGIYAAAFAQMLELTPGQALKVPTKGGTYGSNFKRCLQRIADKEPGTGEVQWTRSADSKTYWFWLEKGGSK